MMSRQPLRPLISRSMASPQKRHRGLLEHFRIDSNHSNAFTAWKEWGSPQSLSPRQDEQLQKEGQLQLLSSPEWISIEKGVAHLKFDLPRQGLSLVRLAW